MNDKANTPPPRILLVGLSPKLPDTDWDGFYTDTHFLDYDIVIMDPRGALEGPGHKYNTYDGTLKLESDKAETFLKRYRRITQKLVDFVNKGGLAIVFLRAMPTLVYTRFARDREVVRVPLDRFLPWDESTVRRAHGSNIEFETKDSMGQFWAATQGLWTYEAVYDDAPKAFRLAHVKGHPDEVVANLLITEERGFVIMTPVLTYEATLDDMLATSATGERFVQAVRSLHESLRTRGPAPQLPEWASDYHLPGEVELRDEMAAANAQIEVLQEQVRQRTEALDKLCLHKLLITAHDSALEGAVDRVLTDLGMKVEPGPKGRVDRTATHGDRKFAVEVQGVKRGAKEDHARALTVWVQEVALQDGKEPKGLLVVNPYRDTPLAERGDKNPWSGDTIKICVRQGHCAMTGIQLLGLYLDAMADDTMREQLIERMFGTEGMFEGYEDWSQFLAPVEGNTPEKS